MTRKKKMTGTKKDPKKEHKGWGGRRMSADGSVANGAPGKPRPTRRKNAAEVAESKTTIRYGESLKARLEAVREPDEETMTDLFLRLIQLGLEQLEALKVKQASGK